MAKPNKSGYPPSQQESTAEATNRRKYWGEQIAKADKRFDTFIQDGDAVTDRFMLESRNPGDKYNILYSSTETIKPSLYGQTPKVEVKNRQTDTEDSIKVAAAMVIEQVGQYCVDQVDYDYTLKNAVSDYVLPGLGTVWVRYDPSFAPMNDNDGKPEVYEDGTQKEYKTGEKVCLDYVFWKNIRWGSARVWEEIPWISREVFFTKKEATKRFGSEKANKLAYTYNMQDRKDRQSQDNPKRQARIYEIWDKENGEAVWYCEDYEDDVLDIRKDPLKLEKFFPCPRPLRAVWATRDFIPKALYSQYKAQAAELDRLTERIRYLTEAIKVRGLYDSSQEGLANLLEGPGNKMIPVQDWAQFIGQGGVAGAIQMVPIQEVSNVLAELFKQREICKNEIYEITGFSDIVRGVSKASETLGAQQIKAEWAGGRLKDMQREVQRFCRDSIALMVEVALEHFSDKTLLLYSGLTIPPVSPEEQQAKMQYMQAVQQYPLMAQQAQAQGQQPPPPPQQPPPTQNEVVTKMWQEVLKLVRSDKLRCAIVNIETDSTILPDEEKERADRMAFLGAMGAFLQQAAPLALQFPDMRGLLGGIMMFTLRTFSASRPLEKEFEEFQKKLAAAPPTPPPGQEGGDKGEAAAQATIQVAQMKDATEKQTSSQSDATKRYEIDKRAEMDREKLQQDHEYRMAQIANEREKLRIEKAKIGLQALGEERTDEVDREDKEFERANAAQDKVIAEVARQDDREAAESDKADQRDQAAREAGERAEDRAQAGELENRKLDVQEKAIKAKPKPGAK